ncbi:hypothetical protein RRG08_054493 [Elysia crispata]|uniref:Smr domain-containing protein n=1 Tax=Elysia crispata TaxID=231223 RepID=A0AAE1D4P3_9GAST|nr:hypothetical protein RRG08_054493 [Elysia crispata]
MDHVLILIFVIIVLVVICAYCCVRRVRRGRRRRENSTVPDIESGLSFTQDPGDLRTLDLHYFTRSRAMVKAKKFIAERMDRFKKFRNHNDQFINIITGRGRHSKNGKAVLKPAIKNYVSAQGFQYQFLNPGMLQINLASKSN